VIFSSPSERSRLCRTPRDFRRSPSSSSPGIRPLHAPLPLPADPSTPGGLRPLRSDGATHRILFHPRGFSPPRRFAPCRCCGFVAPRCRFWGSSRFPVPVPPSLGCGYEPSVSRVAVSLRRVPLVSSRSASLRSLPSCRFRPSSSQTTEAVGLPRGRAMTEAIVAGGRSRRNPRGYLPHRPKPVRHLHSPKPVEALPGDQLAIHRSGRSVDREAGASYPPTFVRCLPKQVREVGRMVWCLPKQVLAIRTGVRCLPKQASGDPQDGESGVNRRPTSQAEAGSHRHRSEDGAGGPCPVSR